MKRPRRHQFASSKKTVVSTSSRMDLRRAVMASDGNHCLICGIGDGEPYPSEAGTRAHLVVADVLHRTPTADSDPYYLRTECARCNEPAREIGTRSESAEEIWPRMRDLKRADKARLLRWMENDQRDRDSVDVFFDLYRSLPSPQRDELKKKLKEAVKSER